MNDTKYNGWTNYATWRVNLEMIDGSDWHCRFDDHGGHRGAERAVGKP